MRTFLIIGSLISLAACDSAPEPGPDGTTTTEATVGADGAAGGGQQVDADGAVADGSPTDANRASIGACHGEEVEFPQSSGDLGLTEGNAMSYLEGQWERGLTPFQEDCKNALRLAIGGHTDDIESMEEGDLRQWALVVANAVNNQRGSAQETSEAQDIFNSLDDLPESNMTISDGELERTGAEPLSGSLAINGVDGNKVTVTLTPSGEGETQTVDIHFASSSLISVSRGAGSTQFQTFRKIN